MNDRKTVKDRPYRNLPSGAGALDDRPATPAQNEIIHVGLIHSQDIYRTGWAHIIAAEPFLRLAFTDRCLPADKKWIACDMVLVSERLMNIRSFFQWYMPYGQWCSAHLILLESAEYTERAVQPPLQAALRLHAGCPPKLLISYIKMVMTGAWIPHTPTFCPSSSLVRQVLQSDCHERTILALIAQGLTNRQIGERLFLSESTVKKQIASLKCRLGCSNRSALAATFVQMIAAYGLADCLRSELS